MLTAQQAWDQMVTRTTTDQAFRAQLLANPVGTLRSAGIAVPDDIVVTPLEFDPKHAYFFLPPPAPAAPPHLQPTKEPPVPGL